MAELIFHCPACGFAHKIDAERVAPAGTRGKCLGCSAAIIVFKDGRAESAGAPAVPQAAPGGAHPPPPPEPPSKAESPKEAAAPAPAIVQFRCPYCGAAGERTLDGIAKEGIVAACGTCVQLFRLFPDGRAEETEEEQAVRSAPAAAAQTAGSPVATGPSGGVIQYSCPFCGAPHEREKAAVPASGAEVVCRMCVMGFTVFPDGRSQAPDDAARPSAAQPPPPKVAKPDGLVLFLCPFCGKEIRVARAKIPPDGARGKCSGCQARLRLQPDGNVELDSIHGQAAQNAPPPAAPESGEQEPTRAESLGDIDNCYAHPGEIPSRACSECHRYLCDKCTSPKRIDGQIKPLVVCAACGGVAPPLPKRVRWTPFYMDLPKVFSAPLTTGALAYFAVMAGMQVLKLFCWAFSAAGLIPFMLLTVFQWVFYLEVIRDVAEGSYDFPGWPDVADIVAMLKSFMKVVLVTAISLFPVFIAGCILMAPLQALMATSGQGESPELSALMFGPMGIVVALFFFLYLFYLPLCVAIVAVFDTILPALNPVLIVKVMMRIGKPYLYAALFWAALFIFNIVLRVLLWKIGLAGGIFYEIIDVYCTLLFCYSLGRVIAENQHKIGWS